MINLYTCWNHKLPLLKDKIPFPQYFRNNVPEKYWIYYLSPLDWNIFGKFLRDVYEPLWYTGADMKEWKRNRREIIDLLIWVQENLFENLSTLNYTSKYILVKIFVSKLNHSSLPEEIKNTVHHNTLICYQIRNAVYVNYDLNILQELPF